MGQRPGDAGLAGPRRTDEQQFPDLSQADAGEVVAVLDGFDDFLYLVFLVGGQHQVGQGHLHLFGGANVHEVQHLLVVLVVGVERLLQFGVDERAVGARRSVLLAGPLVVSALDLVLEGFRQDRIVFEGRGIDPFEEPLLGEVAVRHGDAPREVVAVGEHQPEMAAQGRSTPVASLAVVLVTDSGRSISPSLQKTDRYEAGRSSGSRSRRSL